MTTKNIKQHEEINLHISKRSAKYFLLSILVLGLNILNFMFLVSTWKFLDLKDLSENNTYQVVDLLIAYPIIQQYLLISLLIICIISMFKQIKSYKEDGLIVSLFWGLIVGLIVGLILGLIEGLIKGLIVGLIISLFWGLIMFLILGLILEFEK